MTKTWRPIRIGNGGLITGIDIASDGTMVCRSDSSGAFVWNTSGAGKWDQLHDRTRLTNGDGFTGDLGGGVSEALVAKKAGDSSKILMYKAGQLFLSGDKGLTLTRPAGWTNPERSRVSFCDNSSTKKMGPLGGFDPNHSDIIYLATTTRGMRRSTDAGVTWATVTETSGGLVSGGYGATSLPQAGTDSTSLTAGTGSKTFSNNSVAFGFTADVQSDAKVWSASNPLIQMVGEITASSGTSFTINVDTAFGAALGAKADWNVCPQIRGTTYIGGGNLVAFDTSAGTISAFGKTVTKNVLIHTYGVGTFKSADGGVTWTKIVSTGAPTQIIRWDIDAYGVLWVVTGNYSGFNICKYDIAADTWLAFTAIAGDPSFYQCVSVDPLNSPSKVATTVTFGFVDHGYYRTITDGGASASSGYSFDSTTHRIYDTVPSSPPDVDWYLTFLNAYPDHFWDLGDLKYDPVNSGRIWHGSEGVWYSNMPRSGPPTLTLHQQSRGIEQFIPAQIISPQSGTVILSAWDFIAFRTSSFGTYPSSLSGPLGTSQGDFAALFICYGLDYNAAIAAISIGNSSNVIDNTMNTAWYSLDYGATWTVFPTQPYPGQPPGTSIACSNDGNTFVVLPCRESYGLPKITTNAGVSWANAALPGLTGLENWGYQQFYLPECKYIESDKSTGDIYIYCSQDGVSGDRIFKYTKATTTWSNIGSPHFSFAYLLPQLKSVPGHAGHMLMAAGMTGGVLYSTADGWATQHTVPGFTWAHTLGIAKATISYPEIMVYGTRGGVESYWLCSDFDSSAGTGTWTDVGAAMNILAYPKDMAGDLGIPGQFYVWTADGAMYFGDAATTTTTPILGFSVVHGRGGRNHKMIGY